MLGRAQCKIVVRQDATSGVASLRYLSGIAVALIVGLACLASLPRTASAGTSYVDGVSDQSETAWSGNFAEFFTEAWIKNGHIKYSRMVAQWNALPSFTKWVENAGAKGLGLDLSLTEYTKGKARPEIKEYQRELEAMLTRAYELGHPITYVEPWNEPNGQGEATAQQAAEYDNTAYKVCEADREKGYGCTIIAGNLQDGNKMVTYETEYEKYLKPVPAIWGVHAYKTVEEHIEDKVETRLAEFVDALPKEGVGQQLIITEVGAYNCNGAAKILGEEVQASDAEYLTKFIIPEFAPLHVFYYEFDFENNKPPPCALGVAEDTALFVPETATETGFRPRPAAAWIYSNKKAPWAFTNAAVSVRKRSAEMRGEVYTSGVSTEYWFQYGTTQSYGSDTGKVGVGSGSGIQWAYGPVEGLTPATTYHYRLTAQSSEGTMHGVDKSFTTESAPPGADTWGEYGVGRMTALLEGEVMPDTLATSYWFDYRLVTGGSWLEGAHESLGAMDESWHDVEESLTGLSSCTEYEAKLVASNADGVAEGSATTFRTECRPPEVAGGAAGSIGVESASLEAEVQPRGLSTKFYFEYDTRAYGEGEGGHGTSVPVPDGSAGEGESWKAVSAATGTLLACQEYHFRVVAKSEDGTVYGSDKHFQTKCPAPTAVTEAATETNTFEPQLNATVDPEGSDTHFQFEYGLSESYGQSIPATAEDVGAGRTGVVVAKALSGLERAKTYHFRVVAKNATGTTYGTDKTFTTLPPCKGAEEKCVWSTQTTPNPPPHTDDVATGVECVSSADCVAVGKNLYAEAGFVDVWNGAEWKIISELGGSSLAGMACGSTTSCIAVGKQENTNELRSEKIVYNETFHVWQTESKSMPAPAGGTYVELAAVSCSSSTFCMAVGSYEHESTMKDLVETWNGTSWSIQTPPAEGNGSTAMRGVSCVSSTSCITVGELSSKPTAEHWNGTEWSLMTPPDPMGAAAASLESISCPSTTSCVAVGHFHESGKQNVTLAESWNGTSWSQQSSATPSENEGGSVLLSVSCLSSTSCFAVGDYAKKIFTMQTLAESWNGSTWTLQSTPNPAGATRSTLLADSCTGSIECTAVGSGTPGPSGETTVTLAERWNGTEWSTQTTPNPPPRTDDVATGVECVSSADCVAVGKNLYAEAGFVDVWNGAEWKIISELGGSSLAGMACGSTTSCMAVGKQENTNELRSEKIMYNETFHIWQTESKSMPAPTGGTYVELAAVSCSSSTSCMAVGSYEHESAMKDLVETWNGSAWSIQTPPAEGNGSTAMRGVSCISSTSCITVGELSSKPTAQRWNGSEWSLLSPPNPTGAAAASLESISCPSTTSCVAVGNFHESGKQNVTLAESWNGSAWSQQSSATPSENEGGSVLLSVSCLSSTSCFAVGDYAKKIFTMQTLAESWNGSTWTLQSTPNPTGATRSTLLADSCTSSIECTAVGSGTPGPSGETTVTLAERYE